MCFLKVKRAVFGTSYNQYTILSEIDMNMYVFSAVFVFVYHLDFIADLRFHPRIFCKLILSVLISQVK